MKIYTVSYCVRDQEADANPLWHSFIMLSQFNETTNKFEVVENWGFGGVPASTSNQFFRQFKVNLGIDTDFYGNHGMLYAEEMRLLERGRGLQAMTFDLKTEEKFNALQQKCHKMEDDQFAAITEAIQALNLQPPPPGLKIRNYDYEYASQLIYQYELKQAELENRPPRLHEFSIGIGSESRTCKAVILDLLDGIITEEQMQRVIGYHPTIPRLSGKMEKIFLHSDGPLYEHTRRGGQIAHYRKKNETKLYWTLPPQEIETFSDETRDFLKIHDEYCDEIKLLIRQLQTLEWFFRDAEIASDYSEQRNKLVNHIINLYEDFAKIEPKKAKNVRNDWMSFWQWLASQPRDADEKILLEKIANTKHFILSLYHAIVDGWEENDDENLEIIATFLTPEKQMELCKIIQRNYLELDIENSKILSSENDLTNSKDINHFHAHTPGI